MDAFPLSSSFDLDSLPAQRLTRRLLSRFSVSLDELPFSSSFDDLQAPTHLSFSSYDYLNLRTDPRVLASAGYSLSIYGLTTSSSRLLGGELQPHAALENKLARFYGRQSSLLFVSGHSTNVYTISSLLDYGDLVIADQYCHSSILSGCQLSSAKVMLHKHLDLDQLEAILSGHRSLYRRCLIVTEGLFSMHGDIPDLIRLLEIKHRYGCWLMVDEAHALGVLGADGMGSHQYHNIDPASVDIWSGTLSKALVSTGGYVVASCAVVEHLRFYASGFAYSVGLNAPCCAAAEAALDILAQEPQRCSRLLMNAHYLHTILADAGLTTHSHLDSPIVPVLFPLDKAIAISSRLRGHGIVAFPVVPPAVSLSDSGIRLFVTSAHHFRQLDDLVKALLASTDL